MADYAILTDAIPLLQPDGQTGRNSAFEFRKGLLATLIGPQYNGGSKVRNGVFTQTSAANDLQVNSTPTPGASVVINPGNFASERANQGPYVGFGLTSGGYTITPNASDPSNPRYDIVYALVTDHNYISTDADINAAVKTAYGTAQVGAVPPTLPDGAVALAQIYRPAGSSGNTIQPSNITDIRQGVGLYGAVRHMLPGDSIANPGAYDGEQRYRQAAGSLPSLIDYWDGSQSKWRGTQGFTLTGTFPGTPDGFSHVNGTISGSGNTIISVTIPDPGWPYRVEASGMFWLSAMASSVNYYVNINNNQFAGAIVGKSSTNDPSCPIVPVGGTIFTGSSVAALKIDVLSAGNVTWNADVRNYLTLQVIPA